MKQNTMNEELNIKGYPLVKETTNMKSFNKNDLKEAVGVRDNDREATKALLEILKILELLDKKVQTRVLKSVAVFFGINNLIKDTY